MKKGGTILKEPFRADRFKALMDETGSHMMAEIARVLGVHPVTLHGLVKGKSKPSEELLDKICEAFDCPREYLTGKTSHRMENINA